MTRTLGWLPGYAAIAGLEITMSEPALKARERVIGKAAMEKAAKDLGGVTFHERLGMPEGALKFFALHSYKDRFHGGGELAMLTKYANTPALQREAIWAMRNSLRIYTLHAHEVRRLAAEAAGTVHRHSMGQGDVRAGSLQDLKRHNRNRTSREHQHRSVDSRCRA